MSLSRSPDAQLTFLFFLVELGHCRSVYNTQLGRRSAEIHQDTAAATVMPKNFVPPHDLDFTLEYSKPSVFGIDVASHKQQKLTARDRRNSRGARSKPSSDTVDDEDDIARIRFEAQARNVLSPSTHSLCILR